MCGRFTLAVDAAALREAFPQYAQPEMQAPRYNIAPSQPVLVVPNDGKNAMTFYRWGLVPSWAKDIKVGYKMINARSETLSEKPSFRNAYRRRRCLILADGFYEWRKDPGGKTPMYIQMKSGEPFAFAGLWETWYDPDGGELRTTTIITAAPNEMLAEIHNRMPVILPKDAYEDWLDPAERGADTLQHLMTSYPAEEMKAFAVSTMVNAPANDSPELIAPA